jgi:WD40 repeat protein
MSTPDTAIMLAKVDGSIYTINILDNNRIAIGTNRGELYGVDMGHKRLDTSLELGQGIFCSLVQGHTLWLGCALGYIYQVDLRDWSTQGPWKVAGHHVRCLCSWPAAGLVLAGSSDRSIVALSTNGSVAWKQEGAHDDSVFTLALTPQGHLLSGGKDAYIKQWEMLENGLAQINGIPAHLFAVNQLALHPSGKWFASASRDKTIRLWETETLLLIKVINREKMAGASTHSVNRIMWLDHHHLVAAGDDRVVRVFTLEWQD